MVVHGHTELRWQLLEIEAVRSAGENRDLRTSGSNQPISSEESVDRGVRFSAPEFPRLIHADLLHAERNLAAGATIALIDSGLKEHKVLRRNASGKIVCLPFMMCWMMCWMMSTGRKATGPYGDLVCIGTTQPRRRRMAFYGVMASTGVMAYCGIWCPLEQGCAVEHDRE